MNIDRHAPAIKALLQELTRSEALHGDWSDYDHGDIHKAVRDEYDEYVAALIACDVDGDHGQRIELLQLAVCCLKGYVRLGEVVA